MLGLRRVLKVRKVLTHNLDIVAVFNTWECVGRRGHLDGPYRGQGDETPPASDVFSWTSQDPGQLYHSRRGVGCFSA